MFVRVPLTTKEITVCAKNEDSAQIATLANARAIRKRMNYEVGEIEQTTELESSRLEDVAAEALVRKFEHYRGRIWKGRVTFFVVVPANDDENESVKKSIALLKS